MVNDVKNTIQFRGMYAPNLINVCLNANEYGEISGEMYHCYNKEALHFANIIELLCEADNFYDEISFPQASNNMRSFQEKEKKTVYQVIRPDRLVEQKDVAEHRGLKGTMLLNVRFRQNATWQGEVYWVEKGMVQTFENTLEFIRLIDMMFMN